MALNAKVTRIAATMLEAASFKGRFDWAVIRRASGFYAVLLASIIVLSWISEGLGFSIASIVTSSIGATLLSILVISIAVRRLHNRGLSGWWLLVFFCPHFALICVMEWLVSAGASEDAITLTFLFGGLVAFPSFIWGFVVTFLTKGKPGPNRFGPDPRELTPTLATTPHFP